MTSLRRDPLDINRLARENVPRSGGMSCTAKHISGDREATLASMFDCNCLGCQEELDHLYEQDMELAAEQACWDAQSAG